MLPEGFPFHQFIIELFIIRLTSFLQVNTGVVVAAVDVASVGATAGEGNGSPDTAAVGVSAVVAEEAIGDVRHALKSHWNVMLINDHSTLVFMILHSFDCIYQFNWFLLIT